MEEIKDFLKSSGKCNLMIVLANVLIFLILECIGNTENAEFLLHYGAAFTPWIIEKQEYYRLFTSMFLHFGIEHLFNNMLVLLYLGNTLEKTAGSVRFIIIYFAGGILANAVSCYVDWKTSFYPVSAGASGAVFAVVGSLLYIVLVNKGKLENINGRGLLLMAVLSIYQGYTSVGVDNTAHLGGLLFGFTLAVLLYRKKRIKVGEQQ